MADKFVFANFAVSALQSSVGAAENTIDINVDDIGRFPVLTGGAKFPIILARDDDHIEIMYVVSLAGDGTATVERGREGTVAQSWLAGTTVRHSWTAATVVGAAGFNPRGTWSAGVAYEPGDVVVHSGISYIAVVSSLGSTPSGANVNWQVVYSPPGAAATAMNWLGRWSISTGYTQGQVVEWRGRIWQANGATTGSQPAFGNANWTHIARWSGYGKFDAPLVFAGTNNYTVTIAAADSPADLFDGLTVRGRFGIANTGASTLAITVGSTALAAKPLRFKPGVALVAGDIQVGEVYEFTYESAGDEFVALQSPGTTRAIAAVAAGVGGGTLIPTGAILDYGGAAAPTGYLMCNGQAVSRTTYSVLFGVIGTIFGAGDGSATFNVPDFRGRVAAGVDNMGGAAAANRLTGYTNGVAGGLATHTLTESEMPNHDHVLFDPGHNHPITDPGHSHADQETVPNYTGSYAAGANQGSSSATVTATNTDSSVTGITVGNDVTDITMQETGGGGSHNNVQPTMAVNKIIKT